MTYDKYQITTVAAIVIMILAVGSGAQNNTSPTSGVPNQNSQVITALNTYVQDSASLSKKELPLHAHIAVIAKVIGDSVVVRWAPSKPGGWLSANKTGYIIERAIVTDKAPGESLPFERLSIKPVVPWKLDEWKTRSTQDDHLAAIAAQVLFGKTAVTKASAANDLSYLKFASEELENRWGFALFAADNSGHAAQGLGLRLVDRKVSAGQHIIYRIFAAPGDSGYHLDTGVVFVDVKPSPAPAAPEGLYAEGGDKRIMLEWSSSMPEHFSGYYIERSEDNGSHFKRLNKVPLVVARKSGSKIENARFIDTTISNYVHYRYRVQGITPFAELSIPAEIEAYGKDLTPPPSPHVSKLQRIGSSKLKIEWTMTNKPADLNGFLVTRSADPLRLFHPLMGKPLKEDAHVFIDTAINVDEPYYIVSAIDTAGNIAASLPVYIVYRDSTSPATPIGFAGNIDSSGVVHLRWHADSGSQVLGYRLMWANDPLHEFSQVTSQVITDTTYIDTVSVKTLTRSVYYKLEAINKWYIPSKPTEVLEIKRPHLVKPAAPVITGISVTDSTVSIAWARSPSEMIAQQIIMRKGLNDTGFSQAAIVSIKDSMWVDTHAAHQTVYEYSLFVRDSAGLVSPRSQAMQGRPYYTGVLHGVEKLKAHTNDGKKQVQLSWSYPHTITGEAWFVIYRSIGGAGLTEYKSISGDTLQFIDTGLPVNKEIRYSIRCQSRRGEKSPLSEPVKVVIRGDINGK